MTLHYSVSEDEMLIRLCMEVKKRYPSSRLQTPDYRQHSFYSSQWKAIGRVYYWKMRGDLEPVLAAMVRHRWYCINENGVDPDKLKLEIASV